MILNQMYLEKVVLHKEKIDHQDYIYSLPIIKHMNELLFCKPVTFFIGENGSGKSTLIEAIAVKWGLNPEGGSKNFLFHTRATHSNLHQYLSLIKGYQRPRDSYFLRAETFYNLATNMEDLDRETGLGKRIVDSYGGKSLHQCSHGESFIHLLCNRFGGNGLYILDEPEAALSPSRQMVLLSQLHALVGANSQFIIATHSPILLAYPQAEIYELTSEGIKLTSYKETEHYIITKQFLNNPEKMLQYLLG